jgi:hypothetical protein
VRIAGRLTVLGFDVSERYRQEWRALSPTLARMEAVLA